MQKSTVNTAKETCGESIVYKKTALRLASSLVHNKPVKGLKS